MDDIDDKLRRMRFEAKERKKKSQKLVRKANKKLKYLEQWEKLWDAEKVYKIAKTDGKVLPENDHTFKEPEYKNPENYGEP